MDTIKRRRDCSRSTFPEYPLKGPSTTERSIPGQSEYGGSASRRLPEVRAAPAARGSEAAGLALRAAERRRCSRGPRSSATPTPERTGSPERAAGERRSAGYSGISRLWCSGRKKGTSSGGNVVCCRTFWGRATNMSDTLMETRSWRAQRGFAGTSLFCVFKSGICEPPLFSYPQGITPWRKSCSL